MRRFWQDEIKRFRGLFKTELKALLAAIRRHRDLSERLDLIASVDGIALRTATAILVRLPEIGRISREQAAALAGLAPYDNDSGERDGARHIAGGRQRLRNSLYGAAFAASFHWNAELIELYKRLIAAGKEHKVALVACTRKLLIFANAVVARGTPLGVTRRHHALTSSIGGTRLLCRLLRKFLGSTGKTVSSSRPARVTDDLRRCRQGWPSLLAIPKLAS